MRVCVVGSGAREHALALAFARSAQVIAAPGNPGLERSGHSIRTTLAPPEECEADLFVIGPEAPLVDGLADRLRAKGAAVLGPGAAGARLEGSKAFMKSVATAAKVPTAAWTEVTTKAAARDFFVRLGHGPYVVKTDGLAAGKGVFVTEDLDQALADVEVKLSGAAFGAAGRRLVLEEGLDGQELSLLVLCDGERCLPLPAAQDYKRALDGDRGPNTGGMGAYSPVPLADAALVSAVMDEIVEPTLAELRRRGIDYRGVLYAGLMCDARGPKLIEYNVRFGDPEAQVVLPRLGGDFAELCLHAATGSLRDDQVTGAAPAAVCVVLAAFGYPKAVRVGDAIEGLEAAAAHEQVTILHGATAVEGERLVSAGGRVLTVAATGSDLADARRRAYQAAEEIRFEGMQYRRDIAAEPAGGHLP